MPPGGAEEMDHSYASVDLPPATAAANRVPSPFQFFDLMDDMDSLIGVRGDEDDVSSLESSAETWGDAGASSGSSHHHHPALSSSTTTTTTSTSTLAASGMSMNEESNTNHSQTGSEWSGSNSAVASVTSDYQHAPLSPEPLGELFRPESPPQERLARHATAQVHLPTGFTLTSVSANSRDSRRFKMTKLPRKLSVLTVWINFLSGGAFFTLISIQKLIFFPRKIVHWSNPIDTINQSIDHDSICTRLLEFIN